MFLDHRSADEVLTLVGTQTQGATPLIMACRNGHHQVVEYLVERCNADIEQVGSGEPRTVLAYDGSDRLLFLIESVHITLY